jgi:organic hydroperoxide reductase OsmC/OhrA
VAARRFEYAVTETAGSPAHADPDWTAEHLVLAGLARCTLASLEFHAERSGTAVAGTSTAQGVITKRDEDGRYAFVEVECSLDVTLEPSPTPDALQDLLDFAERDCFIGASLTSPPHYRWRVNGEVVR